MVRQRQIRLAREGVYFTLVMLAMLAGAVGRQLNLLMLVGSVMAGLLAIALVYGRFALRQLTVERRLPRQVHAEQRLTVDISLTNHRRWMGLWGIEVEDVVAAVRKRLRGE